MAFVERLSIEQVKDFARELALRNVEDDFKIYVSKEERFWFVTIEYEWRHEFDVRIKIEDYEQFLYEVGLLDEGQIRKIYAKFMYKIFGGEYKKAYLNNCAKIFDEE